MTVATGCGGSVGGESQIRQWTVNWSNDAQAWSASNTGCATSRLPGVFDWTGNYTFYGVEPARVPGEDFTFQGYDTTHLLSGPAICESLSLTINIEGGGIISGTVNFAANGALTPSKATGSDAGAVDVASSVGCKITADTVAVDDIRTGTFTITRANPKYSSSSTAGQTKRLSGVLDATGSYTAYQTDFTAIPAPGSIIVLDYYVNATEFWSFTSAVVLSIDPVVDIETAAIVGYTLNWGFTAYDEATQGAIITPAGTYLYGSA